MDGVALALTGCAEEPVDSEPTGSMRMALVAPGPAGVTYRLRNAFFDVTGPTSLTLDGETDPNANVLSTSLPAGSYQVALNDGWYVERLEGGFVDIVTAVMQSQNPQQVTLSSNGITDVTFVIMVNNLPVRFEPGQLNVAIEVVECDGTPGEWAGCRGNGCAVCAEQVQGYTRYFQNHPRCVLNTTCDGSFFTCNALCPAPTMADL
jgi:hypothetical protein